MQSPIPGPTEVLRPKSEDSKPPSTQARSCATDEETSAGESQSLRPAWQEPGHRGQEESDRVERAGKIRQWGQPHKVPAHLVEVIGGFDPFEQNARAHLEQPGSQTAPRRQNEHVARAAFASVVPASAPV